METVAVLTNCPLGTVGTRFDDLLSDGLASKGTRGRNGGAEMTPTDRVNLLLAVAIDHPRGETIGEAVRRIRSLEMHAVRLTHGLDISVEQGIRGGFDFVAGLNVGALDRLGAVLDGIVQNMQTGAFALWAAGDEITLTIDFYAKGRAAMLVLDRPDGRGVYFAFGVDEEFRPSEMGVDRFTRMHRHVFERLAAEEETVSA
jgi:hypothetical protein